jgi:hypothetical protein
VDDSQRQRLIAIDAEWLRRYRAAQRARNDRITDWVLARLAALDANLDQELIKDEPFFVYLTVADPRFLNLSLDFPAIGPWLATDA